MLARVPERRADLTAASVTYAGVATKTALFLLITIGVALYPISIFGPETAGTVRTLMITGAIGGFAVALLTIFVQRLAPFTGFLYAALEGLFIGGLAAYLEYSQPGIAINAGMLTMGLFTAILVAYATGIVKVTPRFRMFIGAAIGGIIVAYLLNLMLSMFGTSLPFLHGGGMVGLGINVVIIVIAVLSLAVDFDNVQRLVDQGAEKKYEWILAFGLLVSLVWLYIEVLRLLSRRE